MIHFSHYGMFVLYLTHDMSWIMYLFIILNIQGNVNLNTPVNSNNSLITRIDYSKVLACVLCIVKSFLACKYLMTSNIMDLFRIT
jgi:hypothetical protein